MEIKKSSALKKISAACKAAAKRKFKVWPSAYASGWGVRCTRACLLYTSPSPRDMRRSRMPSSA